MAATMTPGLTEGLPPLPENEDKFTPVTDPVLKRRLKALQARLFGPGDSPIRVFEASVAKKLAARVERLEKKIADAHKQQELAWKRARGLLSWQAGTAREARTREIVTYSRTTGLPHRDFHVVHKATPSTGKPDVSEKRQARRAVEAALGRRLSGRQWVRFRKQVKRAMRADVQEAMQPEPAA